MWFCLTRQGQKRLFSCKSTVIRLIERLCEPVKGSVYIDQNNIKNYNLRQLRSHIAVVCSVLGAKAFPGTIHGNIVYVRENYRESEFIRYTYIIHLPIFSLKLRHITFVTFWQGTFLCSATKDGYQTYCGERVKLSGGQKQRIALARAILKNPTRWWCVGD